MSSPSWSPASPADPLALVFWSAQNSLGENVTSAAAAFRAGATGLRECALVDGKGAALTLCAVPTLDPFLEGLPRLVALAHAVLGALLERAAPFVARERVKLFLLLDEHWALESAGERSVAEELARFARDVTQSRFETRIAIEADATGAGGIAEVLERASREMARHEYECALVLGVHTDHALSRVRELLARDRVHSSENLDALLLGEGATALLLSTPARARSLGLDASITIDAFASTEERARFDNDLSAFEAAGLTVATRRALENLARTGEIVGWISSDVNFEMFRNYELQATLVRTQKRLGAPQHLDTPCQRLGNLGAGTGPWQLAYAAESFFRGDAPASRCLGLTGSDTGARSAVLVSLNH